MHVYLPSTHIYTNANARITRYAFCSQSPLLDHIMDAIFEETSSSILQPDEVTEVEGGVKRTSSYTNNWGPRQYKRNNHPLHIMVRVVCKYTHIQYITLRNRQQTQTMREVYDR